MNDQNEEIEKVEPEGSLAIRLAMVAAVVALAVVGAVKVLELPSFDSFLPGLQGGNAAGSLATVLDEDEREGSVEEVARVPEAEQRPVYEGPSSAYMEEGIDLDTIDFGAPDDRERSGPPILSDRAVQQVISGNQRELLSCYGEELQNDSSLAGDVSFEFAVHPTGRVLMARVASSSLRSKAAEDCFVEHARHWDFPETSQDLPTRFETSMTFQF